ncbi:peroxiredoxin [uncultured Chloroflexus sp.]|uniref:peroxiredoxin family protein n=1 Tax=uncultured Chloroflexus sp. TaxID=214040 RepID=UPI0026362F49|nr:TlpA disulfide reductase family protein [uncultured Chloroflexus sp.]
MNKTQRDWLTLILMIAGVGWIVISRPPDLPSVTVSPRTGFIAPAIALPLANGETLALSALRGQVVIVNFWASWCGPCRAEMPTLEKIYQAEGERGLTILAVNSTVQDDEGAVVVMQREFGLSFPIVFDRNGETGQRYGIRMLPTTFIVDRTGVIREVFFGGPLSEASLRSVIEPLLGE